MRSRPPTQAIVAVAVSTLLLATTLGSPATATSFPTVPSTNESPGCEERDGYRGPYAPFGGWLPDSTEIAGPWGALFGRTIGDIRASLVTVTLPGMDYTKTLYIHEAALPAFEMAVANLEREARDGNVYPIRSRYTSSFSPLTVPPGRHMSYHAMGTAIDINSPWNPYSAENELVTDMPDWFVRAWTDAGWCWGGHWQTIKDPMHFSWKGPVHTPGYVESPPRAPRTAPGGFVDERPLPLVLADASDAIVTDIDRDGGPDLVRILTDDGVTVAALTGHDHWEACRRAATAPIPVPDGAQLRMADHDQDGRPDLWIIDPSGPTVSVTILRYVNRYRAPETFATSIPSDPSAAYLPADVDRDRHTDVIVVHPGTDTKIDVWRGDTYDQLMRSRTFPPATNTAWRFEVGESNGDGIPDVIGIRPGRRAPIRAFPTNDAGVAKRTLLPFAISRDDGVAVYDHDGDGRDDLYLLGSNGHVTVFFGGDRDATRDLDGWFVDWERDFTRGSLCPQDWVLGIDEDTHGTIALGPGGWLAVDGGDGASFTTADGRHRAIEGSLIGAASYRHGPLYRTALLQRNGGVTNVVLVTLSGFTVGVVPVPSASEPLAIAATSGDDPIVSVLDGATRSIVSHRTSDGSAVRTVDLPLAGVSTMAQAPDGTIVVGGVTALGVPNLLLVDPAGVVSEALEVGGAGWTIGDLAIVPSDGLAVAATLAEDASADGAVLVVDLDDRTVRWRRDLGTTAHAEVAAAGPKRRPVVAVLRRDGFSDLVGTQAFSGKTGVPLWSVTHGVSHVPDDIAGLGRRFLVSLIRPRDGDRQVSTLGISGP